MYSRKIRGQRKKIRGQCAGRPARSRWWKSTAMKA
jgi:hypothetical protein